MRPVLASLPYSNASSKILGPGIQEEVRPFQIVVWVSVTPVECFELPRDAKRFPAILDTGFNDCFAIGPLQLRAFAGLDWKALPCEDEDTRFRDYDGVRIPLRRAYLWLHPNSAAERDTMNPDRPAVRLELNDGITVYGNKESVATNPRCLDLRAPRLPLIGLRALTEAECELRIDCKNRFVSLDMPDESELPADLQSYPPPPSP